MGIDAPIKKLIIGGLVILFLFALGGCTSKATPTLSPMRQALTRDASKGAGAVCSRSKYIDESTKHMQRISDLRAHLKIRQQ